MSGATSNRSLAARRGRPYDKGRGFSAQALWVAVSTLVFTQVWCPNRLRCAILRWFGAEIGYRRADQAPSHGPMAMEAVDRRQFVDRHRRRVVQHRQHRHRIRRSDFPARRISVPEATTAGRPPSSSTTARSSSKTARGCARELPCCAASPSARTPSSARPRWFRRTFRRLHCSAAPANHRPDLMRILQVVTLLSPDGAYGGPATRGAQSKRRTDQPGPRRDGGGRHPRLPGPADRAGRGAGQVVSRSDVGPRNRFRRHRVAPAMTSGSGAQRRASTSSTSISPANLSFCQWRWPRGDTSSRTSCRPMAWWCRHTIRSRHRWTRLWTRKVLRDAGDRVLSDAT